MEEAPRKADRQGTGKSAGFDITELGTDPGWASRDSGVPQFPPS